MEKSNLNDNSSVIEMFLAMCEGKPGTVDILMEMMKDKERFLDILLCDKLNIRGNKLYILYNDCCDRNKGKFDRTLSMFRYGVFSEEQIQTNLGLDETIHFIDDKIPIAGVPSYDCTFGPNDEHWDEFCSIQKDVFLIKLSKATDTKVMKK